MSIKKKLTDFLTLGLILFSMIILVLYPERMASGIGDGLMVCGNILIPSLFPFTVLALFLIESNLIQRYLISPVTYSLFVFLLSIIGGYPVGAKVISSSYQKGIISEKDAEKLMYVCINASPAFIITVIGKTIFKDIKVGIMLFFAHILASGVLFCFYISNFHKFDYKFSLQNTSKLSEAFVKSVADACVALINICSYVILFSGIIKFTDNKFLVGFLEVTNGVLQIKNTYFISFLLGFSGICIILQIISIGKNIIKRPLILIFHRILHGLISVINLKILFLIFPIEIQTISNNVNFNFHQVTENTTGSLFLIFFAVIFISSLENKKYSGKLNKDIW